MLSDDGCEEEFKVVVELGGKNMVATELWEFSIDSPNNFNVVRFYKL